MRIWIFLVAVIIAGSQAWADAGWHKYQRKSENERHAWIAQHVERTFPDASSDRAARLNANIQECLESTGDVIPFKISTKVCLELAGEDVR